MTAQEAYDKTNQTEILAVYDEIIDAINLGCTTLRIATELITPIVYERLISDGYMVKRVKRFNNIPSTEICWDMSKKPKT